MSKRPYSKYVDVEAESSEEEIDESVLSEDMDGFVDNTMNDAEYRKIVYKDAYSDKIRDLESRYLDQSQEEEEMDERTAEAPSQAALLPTSESPLLFLVRVKFGKEKLICNRIVENVKMLMTNNPSSNSITAVIQKDGLKGYIYVESFKKSAVDEAVYPIKNVYRNRITAIPFREMVEALSYNKNVVISEFARVKTGKYKNDLVQILDNYEDCCKIKVIPRLENKKKLFDPEEYRNFTTRKDDGYFYNRDFYREGFLIKTILKINLDFDITPTFDELQGLQHRKPLQINDMAKVTKGDLKNLVGTVQSVSNNTVVLNDGTNSYELDSQLVQRHALVGDHVSYQGENGMVLKVEGRKAILGIRNMTEEIEALIDDLKKPVSDKPIEGFNVKKPLHRRNRIDPFVNKAVQITHGPSKGLLGIVKDVYRNSCRVQLNSSLEFTSVDRDHLKLVEKVLAPRPGFTPGYRTVGYQTPGYKTPGYQTPGYKTPGYQTPGYKTPGYQTPGYKTPGYDMEPQETENEDYKGIKIMLGSEITTVTGGDENFFYLKSGEKVRISDAKGIAPQKYDTVFVLRGSRQGLFGAAKSINGGIVEVTAGKEGSFEIGVEDITIKD